MVNKGRIHSELRYFLSIFQIWWKSDKELRYKIMDFSNFRKRTPRRIHEIKTHSIWIKIHGEIKEQNSIEFFNAKRENQNLI